MSSKEGSPTRDPTRELERFMRELVSGVSPGAYVEALRRANITHTRPLPSGQPEHFQIAAATADDAKLLRGSRRWIDRRSVDAGLRAAVVITEPDES